LTICNHSTEAQTLTNQHFSKKVLKVDSDKKWYGSYGTLLEYVRGTATDNMRWKFSEV